MPVYECMPINKSNYAVPYTLISQQNVYECMHTNISDYVIPYTFISQQNAESKVSILKDAIDYIRKLQEDLTHISNYKAELERFNQELMVSIHTYSKYKPHISNHKAELELLMVSILLLLFIFNFICIMFRLLNVCISCMCIHVHAHTQCSTLRWTTHVLYIHTYIHT